jgi:hypothetical protein
MDEILSALITCYSLTMVTARGPGLGLDWDETAVARYAFS